MSDLWGFHIHHVDNHDINIPHFENHSEANHHHEKSNNIAEQDHCVQHCSVENILTHLLEDKTFFRSRGFDFDNNLYEVDTHLNCLEFPIINKPETVSHYSHTIPPPCQSQWKVLTTSPRPPPFLS